MKFLKALFSVKALLIIMGIFIGLLLATRLVNFGASEEEIALAFAKTSFTPQEHFTSFEEGKLHYVTVGDSTKQTLVNIHGSPGSWDAWLSLLTDTDLLQNYYAVVIDRAGYNKTTLAGKYSLHEQSVFLKPLMDKYCNNCIVAGHSYGGGLAMQTGLDYQQKVKGVISIAGTVASQFQKPRFYNYIIHYSPIKWLIAEDLATSNKEMWALQKDLELMETKLEGFTKKVAIIQGNEDVLVDGQSAQLLESKLVKAVVKPIIKDDMNHFVIWSDQDLILQALEWMDH